MPILTSRESTRMSRAKRAANEGPAIIADCGRPAYVLMVTRATGASPRGVWALAPCCRIRKARMWHSSRREWATIRRSSPISRDVFVCVL
jgi:hypothetical protein